MTDTATAPAHLTPDSYHVIGPDDFGVPGLWARESVGPWGPVEAFGPLVTVHDSRFDPRRGIGHHPHRGMERLFYILEGAVDHDDALNHITGHMGTGDLGILTEGRRGMVHSEWNNGDEPARAYILVYPTDPTPATASFDAVRDAEAARVSPAPGVITKQVVERGGNRLRGDVRELTDSSLEGEAALEVRLRSDEAGLVFVVDGRVDVHAEDWAGSGPARMGGEHTALVPPVPRPRELRLVAREPSRVLHAVTGPGFGVRRRGAS
ncbi:MAG: pirin family protein [Actinomycetota bacterium]|nr:pirin family protein [Actinomycetota bacterium]